MNDYERAKDHYKENLANGWNEEAAWNDACCSYMLSIKDAGKLRRYAKLDSEF